MEAEIIPTIKALGIGFVAYSPLGRGFLSGAIRSRNDLKAGDWRLTNPRFTDDAIRHNARLADGVATIAKELASTPAQVSLAWLLAREVPLAAIPGTRQIYRLEENWKSQDLTLSRKHLEMLDSLIQMGVEGDRY